LELQRQVNNKIERVFLHYLKRFGTAENIFKTGTLNGAFWRYLELQRNNWKKRTLNGAFWRYLKRFRTSEKILKTGTLNGAFWRYLELQRN